MNDDEDLTLSELRQRARSGTLTPSQKSLWQELVEGESRLRQAMARVEVRRCERLFREEGNALFAWEARSIARHAGIPTPNWVEDLLDKHNARLLSLAEDTGKSRASPKPREVLRKLDLADPGAKGGRGTPFSRYASYYADAAMARRSEELQAAGHRAFATEAAREAGRADRNDPSDARKRTHVLNLPISKV